MATSQEIADFRLLIAEPTQEFYEDSALSIRIDAADGDTNALAAAIWREKAARYAQMVDMQEGTSRRSLSQLHSQALAMATTFSEEAGGSGGGSNHRTTTRPIERV